ncbi:ATP-binding cassette sub-family A member 13 [Canis lupus familiaris]|uniref:ATP-binding cassette sub-family A member 13 n=1 Tax=Canis lupus familiaris TaxID=9615 RepID=UPI0018F37165|nr:ATP-binding cassette sub-family A member 13 [Canis lupus familiaris]
MGPAGRQFGALLWKNWLCRVRQPVLSLAEFFWPCILFMILTVLRFQEPPRHRDNCFLQARDLPSRGVLPFMQALLCNTGSTCRNVSSPAPSEGPRSSSRFGATAGRREKVNDLAFLEEMQDLAEGIYEILDRAKILRELWAGGSKDADSSHGSSLIAMDLNKTEEVILRLEKLHQQPHIWDFLRLLPRLQANDVCAEDYIRGGVHLLHAASTSLATLEDLDWLPLNHTFSTVSENVLNVTIWMLTFLQEHGVATTEAGDSPSLQKLLWGPRMAQADLKPRFGFDEAHAEQILNYSAELQEVLGRWRQVPAGVPRGLEALGRRQGAGALHAVPLVLGDSVAAAGPGGNHSAPNTIGMLERVLLRGAGGVAPATSAHVQTAVSWVDASPAAAGVMGAAVVRSQLRPPGRHLPRPLDSCPLLASPGASFLALGVIVDGSCPTPSTSLARAPPVRLVSHITASNRKTEQVSLWLLHLQKLEDVLRDLPPRPAPRRPLALSPALGNAIAHKLRFVQGALACLEAAASGGGPGGQEQPGEESLLREQEQGRLHASVSGRAALPCPRGFSDETSVLNKLLRSAEDAGHLLQEVITGRTDMPVSVPGGLLGWPEVEAQLAAVDLSCRRLLRLLGTAASPGDGDLAADCRDPLLAAVVFHTLEEVQLSLEETAYRGAFLGLIRKTCELVCYVHVHGRLPNHPPAFSEESPCYGENMDWEVITDNYFTFLSNFLKSPAASISRVLNSTKELLMMEKKLHPLEDEQIDYFLSFVGFLEKLLPDPFDSPSMPKFHDPPSLTETLLNTSHLWINRLQSLKRDPSAIDSQKLLEFGKAVIDKIETLEHLWIKKESNNILRFMELVLFEINPKLLELWMYGISKGERMKLETLSTLLNFSVPEDARVLSKSLNFSQLFHSDWPQSPAVEMDFVHVSETVISGLYEFGFLKQGQVSKALDTVYAIRNASELFSALSEPEKREVDTILTQIYLNVFHDKDSALLLRIYSSCFQHIYKLLSIQSTESLLSFLAQTSKHILDIIKQFNFQNISKAFAFLYETTGVLEGLSDGSYCQQLLSSFNYLELQAQSLVSTEGPELEVIHATLTGLKQLLMVDEDFRISFFQYMSQLFNGSVEALSGDECFALDNKNISSVDYSTERGSSFILPWTQILSNLSANGSTFNELTAVHCTASWLQMWTEILGNLSQILQFDMNVFIPLHVGLTQLLDELESDVKISESCLGIFPTHHPARLILDLFKNVTQADGFHDWDDFLTLRDLWVVLGDALVWVKSLSPGQVGKSVFTMETALHQLKTFPLNTSASREFFYSLLDVFMELSTNTSEYINRNVRLINHFLSNDVTDYGVKFESVLTQLRETMLLLQNVSHDQDLLSCANIFQNITEFILEDGFLHVNTSQRTLRILAVLNSTFSSEDTISSLKGCIAWVDLMNHLYMMYNSGVAQGSPQGNWRSFGDVGDKINSTLNLVTWILNIKESPCSWNKSDINCVNIVLKNVTDFLNAMLTAIFEKEKVPKFEILLTLLNGSTNQVRMIINNLTRDFDFISQSNWKRFTELILRPVELSDDIPSQFTDLWRHLVALGKEIQKLMKEISSNILENDSSSTSVKFLNIFATSPKEKDVNSLGNSFYQLASYLAFNFSHDLQNPPQIIPHEIMNAVGLGIQLIRDVFNSLTPSVLHKIPQDPGDIQVFKKVASLLRTLKKMDIDLLVNQLEQVSESLTDFLKNVSRLGTRSLGANLLVGLVEKFVDSSRAWNVNHLLKFSRLFPKDDVNAVVDTYYVLPHAVRLLQRGVDKNLTEVLKDVYNFTLLHGISISSVTKEDFAIVIKTLLDTVELISEKPEILSAALTCLPVIWCWNHTASGFQPSLKLDACKSRELTSSSFYSKVASMLNHLHLSPPVGLQCPDEGSQEEISRKMVCVIRELVDWNSILLELSEVFHVKTSLVKTMQEFWHKALPYVPSSENQSNDSISELCPSGPIKQIASQIIAQLKNVNFTKIQLDENFLDKLASLNKILNISEGTEASVRNKISLILEKIMKLPSGDQQPENSTRSLDPPFMTFLDVNLTGSSSEASSSFTKKREAAYNSSYFEKLRLELEQIMTDLSHDFPNRPLLSEIIKEIQMINSETLQNVTLQLAHFFESLGSSLKTSEITEDFLSVIKNWLHKGANQDDSEMIQTLFLLMANGSSPDDLALLIKDIATFLGLLKIISREGNFDVAHLTQLLSQEQLTNFSLVPLLFESFLINSINTLAGSSPEEASNSSDTDLHIMNFIKLTLNQTLSENGERIILPPRSMVDSVEQVLKTFFSVLLEENSEDKISLLLKAFHKDIVAEMSFVPKDKYLEILTLDQFLTTSKEDCLMSIFLSLKETLNRLIKSSFILDNGEFYFDKGRGAKFMRDLFNALLRETPGENKTENNSEFLAVVSRLLFHMNSSEDLLQLSHDLRSALRLVREASRELARLMDELVTSPLQGFRDSCPTLRGVILANLTGLLPFANNPFPLRNRATLEITERLLGVISGAGGESGAPGPLLEMSDTLTMLVRDIADMSHLAASVTSAVELVGRAQKVARKMATMSETHSISNTSDTMKFFDSLYSILQQRVRNIVNELTALQNVDRFTSENINDLLTPFIDLAFGMIGVKPSISQDADVVNTSSSTFSYVNQSKDFSDTLKEIVEFLTSVKSHLGTMEHLTAAFSNGTRISAMGSVNLWEEILDCLDPINNIINQIDFLHPKPLPTRSYPQDTKWERTREVILFFNEMFSQDSTEIGTYLRTVIGRTLEALRNDLEKDDWSIFNLSLTFAQHPDHLLKAIETAGEASGGRDDASGALFSNFSLIQDVTHQQLEEAVQVLLRRMAFVGEELPLNDSQWINSMRTVFQPIFESFMNAATREKITVGKEETVPMPDFPYLLEPLSGFEKYLKGLIELVDYWQDVPLMDQSVAVCQVFQQLRKPPGAVETLQKATALALRVLIIIADNPSLTRDVLCAALSCKQDGTRRLLVPVLRVAAWGLDHYEEIQTMWSSPPRLSCESLGRNLSTSLRRLRGGLEPAAGRGCECPSPLLAAQRLVPTLAHGFQRAWRARLPGLTFLSNVTAAEDVKVKDLMQDTSRLTGELRSSIHISDDTIHRILEAGVSGLQLLPGALALALSGRCDADILRPLLAFPEDPTSAQAARELCGLPGPRAYALVVSLTQNLDLRRLIYKVLMPLEVRRALGALLDVVSRLSQLLPKAGHILEQLPEFLRTYKVTTLLDVPDVPDFDQAPQQGRGGSTAFGSFQFVVKQVCQEPASLFSGSNSFMNLPQVTELLGGDKEKFNIPEDATPFCLNLYQEILQSPNGALVWSFLKPILHGKILYTPNTPEINKVIQKANHTFHFVDKLTTLAETLLKISSIFQSGGSGQMLSQLQEALRNKFVRSFVESQLHLDLDALSGKLQTYGGELDKVFARGGAGRIRFLGRVLVNLSSCVALNRFQALESVASLEAKAQELMRHNNFLASIIFNSSLADRDQGTRPVRLPPHITYTIRTSILYSMRTDLVKNPLWKFHPQNLPADGFKYNYIFVPLQDMIERAIILVQTGREAVEPAVQTQAIPYPCHTRDLFLNNVGFFFPLIMMLTWMVSVASMVRRLVYERQTQIEEYMRMMGVHSTVLFLAWFLENVATLALSSAALAVILKVSGIFAHSNACIVFLFLLDFGVSVVMLSYLLGAFFSRANTAALWASLVYMISFLPYIVLLVLRNQLSVIVQMFLCLLSTTAFGQGVFFVTFLEGQEAGVQWDNLSQPPEQMGMTFGWVCWMILFDSGLYFVCGWYLNNLVPGAFGLRKPWYFPFTASYWKSLCGLAAGGRRAPGPDLSFPHEDSDREGSSRHDGAGAAGGGPPGVALVSVTKEYEPHKAAIRDLSITFHSDQITALLGTNGAGKTTVISVLTGLHPPTSGAVLVHGRSLHTDLAAIRRELGVCPQRDVLLDNLTVLEHLRLFAAIKAPHWTQRTLRREVNRTLEDVELTRHQHTQTRVLSGGMKRKLSIGLAFLGASRTVVLDEPTSGVDPCSRRGIWDILLKHRKGRTVIFTTHHLDEAEALSDRVAVLQQGRLRFCGPPSCLTEAYGQGLLLTLTKQPSVLGADDSQDLARATALIQSHVPHAFLRDSRPGELVYGLPRDTDRARFGALFRALEHNLPCLRLTGFGISDTTLEEVFLTLLQGSKKPSAAERARWDQRPPERARGSCGAPAGTPLAQAAALLVKRLRHTRRAWKGAVSNLLLPVLFVALAMGLFMVRPLATDYPPLELAPGRSEGAEAYFFSSGSDGQELAQVLLRKFGDQDLLCGGLNPDPMNASCWRLDPPSAPRARDSCGCPCANTSAGAPYLTDRLGHTLLNLSAFPLEEYLLLPAAKPRLGGWTFGARIPAQDADPDASQPDTVAKVWYNQKGFHALPSYLNHLNNLILWRHVPAAEDWRRYGITLFSHPYGGALLNEDKILESIRQCGVALCIVLGCAVLTAALGSSVVHDRATSALRLQRISGLGHATYWLANFLFDGVFYLVSVSLCVAVIVAFQLPAFTVRQNLAATALLLALFGYATLPWMYLMSRIFSSSDVAFISFVSLNFIFGLCTMLMTIMPRLLAMVSRAQNLQKIYDVLKWVFTVLPQFCLGQGLIELCYNQIRYDLTHGFGIDSYMSPFQMDFLGWIFVQLAAHGTVLLLLRASLQWDRLPRPRGHSAIQGTVTPSKDIDVEKEQIRVLKGKTSEDLLVLCNLSKSYGSFRRTTAVCDISLGLRRGECFGLLGPNGAGKSSTFKMLNGDCPPTSGHAVIRTPAGELLDLGAAGAAGLRIGYCPQQDALDELLTGWEHLDYYCRLRGVPSPSIPQVAGDLVERLGLEAHVDQLVATYSGGTRRKLSTALALLGSPDLLLLDEPSSGMDPCSKRHLWRTITQEARRGCAVVLTSHSMEECEALCTRLAIMVNGSFRCLGSPQHLKNRFGDGYTVRIWLCQETHAHSAISDCLKLHFPGIQFKGQHLNLLEYHLPKQWECLADLFQVLENQKTFLNIKHYSISQTTLEQVFIKFATEQREPSQSTPATPPDSYQPHRLPI